MSTSHHRAVRALCTAVAGLALLGPAAVIATSEHNADHTLAQPCVNGVVPLNPYVVNCNLGPRPPKIRGSAPDAGAIIACRHDPVCLSYYVNNP
ncbi:hypothetical protein [Mycolicibacterium cosmeticum]|uniref:hypothetical protein n=1 Tax=Mycolicibacterium cosmeticum TaxID=258533 RepID=UPI003204AB72